MDQNKRRALVLTAVVLGGAFWFLVLVQSILMPFVVGLVLAYLLNPLVQQLEDWGVPRPLASVIPVVTAIFLIVLGLVLGLPMVVDQMASFLQRLPVYLMTLQHFVIPSKLSKLVPLQLSVEALLKPLGMFGAKGAEMTLQALQKTISGVAWLVNVGMLVVMTPLVSFYLLMDWQAIVDKALVQLPRKWRKETVTLAKEIDTKLAAYLRGTLAVCATLAAFYAMALTNIGWIASLMSGHTLDNLEMGWAIGLMTGFLAFFPVIGSFIGVSTMLAVALVQYQLLVWEPYALIGVIFFIGQTLESYVLTPLLIGQRVGLHPLWVMFALLAGGALGGITGMLAAIPVAVVLSVVLPRVLTAWREAVN